MVREPEEHAVVRAAVELVAALDGEPDAPPRDDALAALEAAVGELLLGRATRLMSGPPCPGEARRRAGQPLP